MTGIDSPYEQPSHPDVVVTERMGPAAAAACVIVTLDRQAESSADVA
jgi:adenylylsulfate kinase-like enzyme